MALLLCCLRQKMEKTKRKRQMNKQLREIHRDFETAVKILLLGTSESGKTTIIKQMRILHINGFSDEERKEKITEIYSNIHESIYELVKQMKLLGIKYETPEGKRSGQFISSLGESVPKTLSEAYRDHVLTLWEDSGIRTCYERSNEFQLLDSAKYFLDRVKMIIRDDYLPSTEAILHSRKVTTGIQQIKFPVKVPISKGGGIQEFRMFDVGGQRDQRNKWFQVFEGVQSILFLISCGDFDQTLREDHTQNRLTEAIDLFRRVWHSRFLSNIGIIVFLNKQDVMQRKICAGKSIGNYFPEYYDFKKISKHEHYFDESDWTKYFIKDKLEQITQEPPKRKPNSRRQNIPRECFYHFTVATDTNNIRKVFKGVYSMIVRNNLISMGLL